MQITYLNLDGEPAQPAEYKRDYFELEIVAQTTNYRYSTSEGEFLCAYGSEPTFWAAYLEALLSTTIGGAAYQAYRNAQADAETLTEKWAVQIPFKVEHSTDDGSADDEGFDPYAGNLDELLGY